jgi:imidazoleglycerol-phosphate dehydratase
MVGTRGRLIVSDTRSASIERNTRETQIRAEIDLDGTGSNDVQCEIGFFAHMLEAFSKHGHFDLVLHIAGDLHIDQHHTVEDAGLVLGRAFREALGDRKGIWRTGHCRFPMDEALAVVSIDLSGRPYLHFEAAFGKEQVGDFQTDMVIEFFRAVSQSLGATVHVDLLRGDNAHHCIEAIFKAFGRALEISASHHPRARTVPSTKGSLDG